MWSLDMIRKIISKFGFKTFIICAVNLFGINASQAYIYSHFDKGLQKAKEYELHYQKTSHNNDAHKNENSNAEYKAIKKFDYRPFNLNKQLNTYFRGFNLR